MIAYENLLYSPLINLSQSGVNICMINASEKIKILNKNIVETNIINKFLGILILNMVMQLVA